MKEVIKKCKCGIYLTINKHRDYYETVEQAVDEINEMDKNNNGHHADYEPEISEELKSRLIGTNCIYELQFYPDTPIGFYTVYGSTLEEVEEKALEILKSNYHE